MYSAQCSAILDLQDQCTVVSACSHLTTLYGIMDNQWRSGKNSFTWAVHFIQKEYQRTFPELNLVKVTLLYEYPISSFICFLMSNKIFWVYVMKLLHRISLWRSCNAPPVHTASCDSCKQKWMPYYSAHHFVNLFRKGRERGKMWRERRERILTLELRAPGVYHLSYLS